MLRSTILLSALAAVAQAHMTIWHPSMYGVGENFEYVVPGQPSDPISPDQTDVSDWWFRGPDYRALAPFDRSDGTVMALPAGETIMLEVACHIAWTSYGVSTTEPGSDLDACPGNVGAHHAGDPNADALDVSLIAGCALGIADVDDISLVTMDNLAIFSVQEDCVHHKQTYFDVPAAMPACTGEKCICAWFWLANNGTANFYMTGFDCSVTGASPTALPIAPPQDPVDCSDDASLCVSGSKRPIYAYEAVTNQPYWDNSHRPAYDTRFNFKNGAQNDIFYTSAPVVTSSSSSVAVSSTSTSSTASASSTTVPVVVAPVPTTTTTTVVPTTTTVVPTTTTVVPVTTTTVVPVTTTTTVSITTVAPTTTTTKTTTTVAPTTVSTTTVAPVTTTTTTSSKPATTTTTTTTTTVAPTTTTTVVPTTTTTSTTTTTTTTTVAPTTTTTVVPTTTTTLKTTTTVAPTTTTTTTTVKPTTTTAATTTTTTTTTTTKITTTSAAATTTAAVKNLALSATVKASSEWPNSLAKAAIDGNLGGYITDTEGDETVEWSAYATGVGSWITLSWPTAQNFNQIVLYDRPNTVDQITSGNITFTDGTGFTFGALVNNGAATVLNLASTVTTTSIKMYVLGVKSGTQNSGLSEFQVYLADASKFGSTNLYVPLLPVVVTVPVKLPSKGKGSRFARHARDFTLTE